VVGDGDQAMQFLRRAEGFAEALGPAGSCSTSTLPRRTGLEILADLKADQDLLTIAGSWSSSSFRARRNGQRIFVPPIACRGYGDG
jgi:hypothetical protein